MGKLFGYKSRVRTQLRDANEFRLYLSHFKHSEWHSYFLTSSSFKWSERMSDLWINTANKCDTSEKQKTQLRNGLASFRDASGNCLLFSKFIAFYTACWSLCVGFGEQSHLLL